jgi:serine/threonine protein kinase
MSKLHSKRVYFFKLDDLTRGVGTRLYASPEQAAFFSKKPEKCPPKGPGKTENFKFKKISDKKENYDDKTDIFSLGLIFFELWHPFRSDGERVLTLTRLRQG